MEWSQTYSLGIQEIDDQHKGLLGCFTRIEDAIACGESWSDVHFKIVELREYAERHFAFEEALMRLYGDDGIMRHAAEHARFFGSLDEIEHKSIRNDAESEMTHFLRKWLTDHILCIDKEFTERILSGVPVIRSTAA